jgi:phosphoribosylformylglycinamidine synthase
MKTFQVSVTVRLQPEVVDPVGATIQTGLRNLGFTTVSGARVGKLVEFRLEAENPDEARERTKEMSDRLLANPVIEDYEVKIAEVSLEGAT